MIKSAHSYSVSQLFDTASHLVYEVPRYQREYAWGKWQWERIFDDIWDNEPGYFLGSIICINQSSDILALQKLQLVDGQQRLATLSLLFASIFEVLNSRKEDLEGKHQAKLFNLMWRLVLENEVDAIRLVPQIQSNNLRDYRAVLSQCGVLASCETLPYAGNRRIFRAYYYFRDRLEQMVEGEENQIESVFNFLDKVNQACMVKIEVASHADAYTLFESLNNRGMPLTAVDLIKNNLLSQLEKEDPGKLDHYFGRWNLLLNYLGDEYETQERFFRQYYNAFRDELKAIHQVPVATRSNLIQIYEKIINHSPQTFLQKVIEASQQYSLLLLNNRDELLNGLGKSFKDLERIQGTPSYLLLLYLLVYLKDLHLSEAQLQRIVSLLVLFFVRRNLTDAPPTRDLTRMFMSMIDSIKELSGEKIVSFVGEHLASVSATDEELRRKLEGPIYEENVSVTRFILCALAEQSLTKETWVDLWAQENKRYVWTIEHIFPQSENIPQEWINMIAEGDSKRAKEIQQTHVHKIGNLTISGFNSALSNKSFLEKRDRTDRRGRAVGYKNKLKLNEDVVSEEEWTVSKIEARTMRLVEETINMFSFKANKQS